MKPFLIYCLKEPNTGEIRYFGQTNQKIQARFFAHAAKQTNTHVSRWFHKTRNSGKDPQIEVLISGLTKIEANEEEIALIAWGRKSGLRITNLTDGGDGRSGFSPSKETIEKIIAWNRGKTVSPETREKLRKANLGKKQSPETISKRILRGDKHWTYGKSRTEETKAKISSSLSGKVQSPEQIEKRINSLPTGDNHWTRKMGANSEIRQKMSASAKAWRRAKKIENTQLT